MTNKNNANSMTGFGKGVASNELFEVTTEIKSVNHRFKDIRFRMSSLFNPIEITLRKELEAKFKRGSFDISINYRQEKSSGLKADLDFDKINTFISNLQSSITHKEIPFSIKPTDFLRNEFYQEDESKQEVLTELVLNSFKAATEQLEKSRAEEGEKLIQIMVNHRDLFETYYKNIQGLKDTYEQNVKDKLKSKFKEESLETLIDEPRFVQEVIYYLEKLDVDEELNRITSHLTKLDSLINEKKKEIGREIDFVLQELNRETNTIGSKSGSEDISNNVIKMKVEMEKMREQSLNLE